MNLEQVINEVGTVTEEGLTLMGLSDLGLLAAELARATAVVTKAISTHQSILSVEVAAADIGADAAEDMKFGKK